jgi:hypothetical protein
MLGKTCRLCVVCEVLIAHEHEIAPLLAASGVATDGAAKNYLVLGTVDTRVWRSGMGGEVSLDAVKRSMADFKEYLRVDVAPDGWYRDGQGPSQ